MTDHAGRLRLGRWSELQSWAAPLRLAVFVHEQGVPIDMEWDEDDALSLHAVLVGADGAGAATGRLLPVFQEGADIGFSRIGRMAVRRDRRGQGLGALVLDALLHAAIHRGDAGVLLHAQCSAQGFYAGRGFEPRGDVFDEAGIAHIEMIRRFAARNSER
ncbi:GNAT family N-acetyltransferase [Xylophilus sp. GOD-11R]|uniref:GNAT family N-acetyltransferase n=1 Tax=Xylophilus sp. GOD-11R TaxID=3089814 RepID=UPI00298C5899|nr:GNAT family N-acetyltransferase [Xylophilus sp. GOD-11R]WPB59244.1 GNAT family N-acetyltransferase [Xylophilus sp. GOD-11R]